MASPKATLCDLVTFEAFTDKFSRQGAKSQCHSSDQGIGCALREVAKLL